MISLSKLYRKKEFDPVMQDLLTGKISKERRKLLLDALMSDLSFREDICDWIKSLRNNESGCG